jgi:hypothetical protein
MSIRTSPCTPFPAESRGRHSLLALAALLVLTGLAWPWLQGDAVQRPAAAPLTPASLSQPTIEFVPIAQIEVGQRVPAENPVEEWDGSLGVEVDPVTWRKLTLSCPKRDGTSAQVVLLRPNWWLADQGAAVGRTVFISVPECGIDGNADILAIEPCPPIPAGPGEVVTGTFRHTSADVIDLHIAGLDEPIGVTANHRFWSEDRWDFVDAGQLVPGERLRGMAGTLAVQTITPRSARESVFNIEVHGTHTYCITSAGCLVHNAPGDAACEKILREAKAYHRQLLKELQNKYGRGQVPKEEIASARQRVYERFGDPRTKAPDVRTLTPVSDPDRPTYKRGHAGQPVIDHIKARAAGGHPTDPSNLHLKPWEWNSRKGAFEGQLIEARRFYIQQFVEQGVSPTDAAHMADEVLAEEWQWLMNDVLAGPRDPNVLDQIPWPESR